MAHPWIVYRHGSPWQGYYLSPGQWTPNRHLATRFLNRATAEAIAAEVGGIVARAPYPFALSNLPKVTRKGAKTGQYRVHDAVYVGGEGVAVCQPTPGKWHRLPNNLPTTCPRCLAMRPAPQVVRG